MKDHPSAISGIFKKPFAEQVAFFRGKLGKLMPTARWDDIQKSAHDRAFMVAGAAKADLLADLGQAVDKSISQGTSLGEFRKDFKSIVAKRGWTGWTGDSSVKGKAWRTRIIYTTNAQTAYNAGRYAQLQDFDYWVYRHNDAVKSPRMQHLGWDGLVLPRGHVFWTTHSPQNGWGCNCYVLGARSPDSAKRLGGDNAKNLPKDWQAISPKTGTPEGIGKGWDYQPGQSVVDVIKATAEKSVHWPYELSKAYMASLPAANRDLLAESYRGLESTAKAAKSYASKAIDKQTIAPYFTLGLLTLQQQQKVEKLLDGKSVNGFDFALDESSIGHVLKQHGNASVETNRGQRAIEYVDFGAIPEILNSYDAILYPDARGVSSSKMIKVVKQLGNERWNLVFEYRQKRRMMVLKTFYIQSGSE